jgi:hypothetical protein
MMYLCEKTDKFLPADPVARVPDQSKHLRPHAGKGAGFGDQVLRGPLRQFVALCPGRPWGIAVDGEQ